MKLLYLTVISTVVPLSLGWPFAKRQAKTLVDADTYQKLVYYAGFPTLTGALANGSCPSPANGAELIQYFNINSTDTQAAIWRSSSTNELVVAFPGSASIQDFVTDFNFGLTTYQSANVNCPGGCLAHAGFLEAWNSIEPTISAALADALSANPGYSTVLSGHSLGAALAALAFASLKNGPYDVAAAYTYGQPRVGNAALANYLDSLSGASDTNPGTLHRVTHGDDGVTQLPPTLFGFVHSRTEFWESATPADVSSTYRCYGQEPSDCVDSTGGFGINAAHGLYAGLDVACQ